MTHDEAEALTEFLQAAFPQMTEEQAGFFKARLPTLNAAEGSSAILNGIKVWKFCPSWAEVIEFYKIERAKAQQEERIEQGFDLPQKGEIPLWVKRWLFARFIHTPPDLRWFPEQRDFRAPEGDWMPEGMYEFEAQALTAKQLNAAVQVALGPRGQSDEQILGVLKASLGLSDA